MISHRNVSPSFLVGTVAVLGSLVLGTFSALGQTIELRQTVGSSLNVESPNRKTKTTENELDKWKGSSLGIRLNVSGSTPVIEDIYPHVKATSSFKIGDEIKRIEDLNFPENDMDDFADLMNRTDPQTVLKSVVQREGKELEIQVKTYRKEFVDIHAIHRRLNGNRIIEDYLQKTNRPDLLDEITTRMAKAVQASQTPREASEALNRIIDEIGVSHTAIIPASAGLAFSSKSKGSPGILIQRHDIDGRRAYFVVDKKPGGSAFDSDLLLGDEVLTINGVPVEKSRRLHLSGHEDRYHLFKIAAKLGETIEIEYLRSPFDDSAIALIETNADPTTVNALRASSRVIQHQGQEIGYVRFWNLMTMAVSSELSKLMKNEFSGCDAVILDLRGRGGIVPAVIALNRLVQKIEIPVVVTIDGLTRSAKEMLTYLVKKHEHVLVVGSKTSGAVTGATMMKLPSGNSLMFPVASADSLKQFVDGEIIEGVGVEPDLRVEYFIPYSAGKDRIYNFALKKAAELANEQEASSIPN